MSSKLGSRASSESSGLAFFGRQFTKPKPLPSDIQLTGCVAIVTGSSSGLGFEASRQLLALGLSYLIVAVRSQAKGDLAASKLRADFPKATVSVWLLDLESYDSVQAFAERCRTLPRIDIAILNAGLRKPSFTTVPNTHHETVMQVNYLSSALLAILLLPILKSKSATSTRPPTLTLAGSDLMYTVAVDDSRGPILQQFDDAGAYNQFSVYSKSKLLLALFVSKLAEFVDAKDVLVHITNPGMTKGTNMFRESSAPAKLIFGALNQMMGRQAEVAASNYVYATVVSGPDDHGSFVSDWTVKPFPEMWYTAEGQEYSRRLWEETMEELEFARASKILDEMRGARLEAPQLLDRTVMFQAGGPVEENFTMADPNFISSLADSLSAESGILGDESSTEWKASMDRWSHYSLKTPSAIIQPKTEADVVTAVQRLVSASIPFVPASGGHSPFSTVGKEGVIIDLSQFSGVKVDETNDLATVRGGTLMRKLQTALHTHGRFAAVGSGSTVGVIPYYIGGGISAYTPLLGYGAENIVAAKIVTAEGDLVRVSHTENADLLWGLRGAGQFLGLVVELTIRTYPYSLMGNEQGQRMLGTYIFPADKLDAVSAAMVPIMESEECASAGHFSVALAPPDFQHQVLLVAPQVFATAEKAEKLLKPLVDLEPMMQSLEPSTFEKHSDHLDHLCAKGSFKRFTQIGMTSFSKDNFGELIKLHRELVTGCPDAAMSAFSVEWHTRCKKSRENTSFGLTEVDYWMNMLSWYQDPKSHEYIGTADRRAQAISRKGDDEDVFVSYTNTSRDDPISWRYKGEDRIDRLRALKKKWDPKGVFTKTFL